MSADPHSEPARTDVRRHQILQRSGARRAALAGPLLALSLVLAVLPLRPARVGAIVGESVAVNFQSSGAVVPDGHVRDFGEAYDDTRGRGWVDGVGQPLSLVGNGRDRNATADQRLDTLITPTDADGVTGRWEQRVDDGTYDVTATVGDSAPTTGSVSDLVVEGTVAVAAFVASASERHRQVSVRVVVTDGRMTLTPGDATSLNSVSFTQVDTVSAAAADCSDATVPLAAFNFQPAGAPVPAGFVLDSGAAFSDAAGRGWRTSSGTPVAIAGNTVDRDHPGTSQLLDTFVHLQFEGPPEEGSQVQAQWGQHLELEGSYLVTVAVGDAVSINSRHVINVEGRRTIDNFAPTTQQRHLTRSVCVEVTDGELTIDAIGGDNTKLHYVQIFSPVPQFVQSDPDNGAIGVFPCAGVTLVTSRGLDASTLTSDTFQLRTPGGALVPGTYNSDAAGGVAGFQPVHPVDPDKPALGAGATYTLTTTTGVRDKNGIPFEPFTTSFTTANTPVDTCAEVNFDRTSFDDVTGPTSVTFGPDGKLYVSTSYGEIRRYTLGANGLPTGPAQSWFPFGEFTRIIIGMAFEPDPDHVAGDQLRLWVSNNAFGFGNGIENFSGAITLLTGTTNTTLTPVANSGIVGLPRSVKDHMTNSVEFGPDGRLYFGQGSQSGYGAPDNGWANRTETPLSAAILVADVAGDPTFTDGSAVNVQTSAPVNYNPGAPGAKVTAFADGVRNPYDLVWTTDGRLFSGVNEAARGDVPGGAANGRSWNEYIGVGSGTDFVSEIVAGRYYGHPNPSIGKLVLNGGNPTAGVDPFEFDHFQVDNPNGNAPPDDDGYPQGVLPDASWKEPFVDLGLHVSPNGMDQYVSDVFGGQLEDWLLVVEYSQGDRIVGLDPEATSIDVDDPDDPGFLEVARGFFNPLDLRVDRDTGRIYVAEFGSDPDGTGGKVTMLQPVSNVVFTDVARVNFNFEPGQLPPGNTRVAPDVVDYIDDWGRSYGLKDSGGPEEGVYGWVNPANGSPKSIVGEGRYRENAFDDDRNQLQATLIHMQGASGNANWEWGIDPSDSLCFDVTVALGDAGNALDSTHYVAVEGVTVVGPYVPAAPKDFRVGSARVKVADGRITLSPLPSGTNTKIDYVEITRVDGLDDNCQPV